MQKKENRKIVYTKRVLRESLLELLKEKPLNKITVKEITELADINRATFYSHYIDRDDLVREIEVEMAHHVIEAMDNLYRSENYRDTVISALLNAMLENKEVCIWFMDDASTGIGRDMIAAFAREKCLPVWMAKRGLTHEQAEWFFTYIYGGGFAFLKEWYNRGFAGDTREIKRLFDDFVKANLGYIYG